MGDDLGGGRFKWQGGALATDEAIYCIPACSTTQILVIDPFKELAMTMQNNILKYPKELGWLFAKKDDGGCNETCYGGAHFESLALRKFLNSSLKNASPRMKNGPTLVVATSHYLW